MKYLHLVLTATNSPYELHVSCFYAAVNLLNHIINVTIAIDLFIPCNNYLSPQFPFPSYNITIDTFYPHASYVSLNELSSFLNFVLIRYIAFMQCASTKTFSMKSFNNNSTSLHT